MPKNKIDNLPKRGAAAMGELYEVGSLVAADVLSKPAVNEKKMTVRMRISTDCIDRERMVILQDGIDLSLYVNNPVVLYGHGEEGIVTPVAMSEDDDGNCTVFRTDDGTYAIAKHQKKDKYSSQIFDAVSVGLLRASSVGVTPKSVTMQYDKQSKKIPVVEACFLNEWSYCAVGVNPEAIIKSNRSSRFSSEILTAYALQCEAVDRILTSNKLDGSEILPEIKRSLMRLAPAKKVYGKGVDMARRLSLTKAQISGMSAGQLAKSLTKMASYDLETQKMLNQEVEKMLESEEENDEYEEVDSAPPAAEGEEMESDDEMPEEIEKDMPASGPEEDPMTEAAVEESSPGSGSPKQGSQVLTAFHEDLSGLISKAEASIGSTENERVVKGLEKELSKLRDCQMAIEALHNGEYADAPKLGGGDEPETTSEMVKAWMRRDSRNKRCVTAICDRLKTLAGRVEANRARPSQVAKSLTRWSDDLHRIVRDAESIETDEEVAERIETLEKSLRAALEKLDKTPAPIRGAR